MKWVSRVVALALLVSALGGCTEDAVGVGGVGGGVDLDAGNNAVNNDAPEEVGEPDIEEPDAEPDVEEPDVDPGPVDCARDADCPEGEVCVVDLTDPEHPTVCAEPVGEGPTGAACTEDDQCASGLCLDGACAAPCVEDADCPSPQGCEPREVSPGVELALCGPDPCDTADSCPEELACRAQRGVGTLDFICGEVVDGDRETGQGCDEDSQCASDLCFEGRCAAPCGEDADCQGPVPLECLDRQVPVEEGDANARLCVGPPTCLRDEDCAEGQICRMVRTPDTLERFCGPPEEPGLPPGAGCTEDAQCAGGLCQAGTCTQPCLGDEDCVEGLVCQNRVVELEEENTEAQLCAVLPEDACGNDADCADEERCVGRRRPDRVDFVCGQLNDRGVEDNQPCEADADCGRNLCLEGVCAAPCRLGGDCAEGLLCARRQARVDLGQADVQVCVSPEPCEASDQCQQDQTCFVRPVGDEAVETVCLPPNEGGRPLGTPCAGDDQCASNVCLTDFLSTVCTHPCGEDADCPQEGYRCLERPLRGTDASRTRVCVPPEPTPCLTNGDCVGGQRCRVVANRDQTALVSVCGDAPGATLPGAPCDADDECDTGLCVEGFCSALCQARAQCGPEQICELQTIEQGELSGRFQACRTLPDVICEANSQCSEGNRVCGQINFGNPTQIECTFPINDGDPIGTPCEGRISPNDQCFNRMCLRGVTDECTAACITNSDCQGVPGGYVCTEFGFQGGALRLCANDCGNDNDCAREDQLCGLSRNTGDDRFEFVCRRQMGTDPPGSDCSQQVNCDHGVCLIRGDARTCTLPCLVDADCPPELPSCGEATIQRPSSQTPQTLRVCSLR